MTENSVKIRPTLADMKVGEKVAFPIEQLRSVRAIASDVGTILNRRYQTRTNREAREVNVVRTA